MVDYSKSEEGWHRFEKIINEESVNTYQSAIKGNIKTTLLKIVAIEGHPHQYDAQLKLWDLGYKSDSQSLLIQIAETVDHPYEYDAAVRLLTIKSSLAKQRSFSTEFIDASIGRFFENQTYPRRFEVAIKLLESSAYKSQALQILVQIAQTPGHAHRYDAASKLWPLDRGAYQPAVRDAIIEAARIPGDHQKEAIGLLRESNNEADQQLGAELQYQFFPVSLSRETALKKEQFNLEAIRGVMPVGLADFSTEYTNQWLLDKFNELMEKISLDEYLGTPPSAEGAEGSERKVNPYFLDMKAITGGDTQISLEDLKKRTRGFLKTLLGIPLEIGEDRGWQMYEDNKPSMINALKHLALAVERQLAEDPQTALLNFSMVLNGMLYCPTGQAEGIQTAVNSLINYKMALSSDLREAIGRQVIAKTVVQEFNNAFNQRGAVHVISRARTALNPELRLGNALPDFKERISRISDRDIPDFFNEFYARFTPANIIAEFNRNLQKPEEFNYASIHHDSRAKAIKQQKPFNVGMIVTWLHAQGVTGDEIHNEYDISTDYQEITDYGLMRVLLKMGFFNEGSIKLHQFMEILEGRRINQLNERTVRQLAEEDRLKREQQEREAKAPPANITANAALTIGSVDQNPGTTEELRAARLKALGGAGGGGKG